MKPVDLKSLMHALRTQGGRLLAFDVGVKYVGLAVSDPDNLVAIPHSVMNLKYTSFMSNMENIDSLVKKYSITGFVMGYPLVLAGLRDKQCVRVDFFIKDIEKTGKFEDICYFLEDERLTSKAVKNVIKSLKFTSTVEKRISDKFAAVSILQTCLDRISRHGDKPQRLTSKAPK